MSSSIAVQATYNAATTLGAGQALSLLSGVTITDSMSSPIKPQIESARITLDNPAAGTLSLAPGYGGGLTLTAGTAAGTYLLAAPTGASAAAAAAALDALVFTASLGHGPMTTGFSLVVLNGEGRLSATVADAALLTINPGPFLTPVPAPTLQTGLTAVIGTLDPRLPGDTLTLATSTLSAGGSLSLHLVNGVEEVIFTAPSSLAGATTDVVSYTVTDQHGAAATATATIALQPAETVTSVAASVASGGTVTTGATVSFTLTPSASVSVTGTPTLTLSDGGDAVFSSLDAAGKLVFTTTVQAGQSTPDLKVTGMVANGASIGAASGATVPPQTAYAVGSFPSALAVADVNGTTEIIAANQTSKSVSVLAANGSGGFGAQTTYAVGNSPNGVAVADVNGTTEIFTVNVGDNTVSVLAANGSGGFGPQTTYAVGSFPSALAVADVNGTTEIITTNSGTNTVSVLAANGSGGFGAQTTYAVGNSPHGVAVADVNGTTEIITANNGTNTVSVLAANGSGGFGAQTTYAVGNSPQAVAVADVNGTTEIITANALDNTVSVLAANGSGGFGPQTTYAVGNSPNGVAVADVNGTTEIITANALDNTVSVLAANGSGGFGPQTTYTVGSYPGGLAVADVNGTSEIITTNSGTNTVSVLAVSLSPSVTLSAAGADTGIVVNPPITLSATYTAAATLGAGQTLVPLSGVTLTDPYAAQTETATITLGNPAAGVLSLVGTYGGGLTLTGGTTAGSYVLSGSSAAVAAALDALVFTASLGHGKMTTGVSLTVTDTAGQSATSADVAPLTIDPGPRLTPVPAPALQPGLTAVIGALDPGLPGDMLTLATSTLSAGGSLSLQLVNGVEEVIFTAPAGIAATTADVIGYTVTDQHGATTTAIATVALQPAATITALAASVASGGTVAVTGGTISLTLTPSASVSVTGPPTLTLNDGGVATFSSLDAAGNLVFTTVVQAGQSAADLTVTGLVANGAIIGAASAATVQPQTAYAVGNHPVGVAVADVNGTTEIITANNTSQTVSVLKANGSGGFGPQTTYAVGSVPVALAVADVNGTTEIITANNGTNTVSVLAANGSGGFGAATTYAVGATPLAVAVADVNGTTEVITTNFNSHSVSVLAANGSGGFGAATTYAVGPNPFAVAVADVNGTTEIITANFSGNTVSVLAANGSGGFGLQATYAVGYNPQGVAVADVNGTTEIITANSNSDTVSVLAANGSGGFGAQTTYAVGRGPQAVAVADVNGTTDIIAANALDNTVSVLAANGSGGFGAQTTYAVGNSPNGVAVADVNGTTEIIATNSGDNTVSVLPLSLSPAVTLSTSGVGSLAGANTGIVVNPVCFLAGTRIATPAGEVRVEDLRPGDLVCLADGGAMPVRWLGQQTISRRFSDPVRHWPVRVRAGALAPNVPCRDLLLSPGHALCLDEVLAQAGALVNGISIRREAQVPERFVYWHVELATHALLLAEGAAAESYLDGCEDVVFDNAADRPDPAAEATELPYPRCKSSRQLPPALREALAGRAARMLPATTVA